MIAMKADVSTTLGEMFVKADKTSVKAGKVTFAVTNTGATTHGLAIVAAPARAAACSTSPRFSPTRSPVTAGAQPASAAPRVD